MTAKKQKAAITKQIKQTKRRTALAFVPKKENQYRPYSIRRYGILIVIALVIGLQFGYNYTQTGSVMGRVTTITSAGLLLETNEKRADAGAPKLTLDEQLSKAAKLKANDILEKQYWDHVSPDGAEPWQWIDDVGYSYQEAGENLAKNFTTASGVVSGWMASQSHKDNMLKSSYKDVGFAVASGELEGKPVTIVVGLYANPAQNLNSLINSKSYTAYAADSATNTTKDLSLAARLGIAIQSLTPAAITSVALLFVSATVATVSHSYRKKLPKRLQKTWYKDHGVIKASGLLAIGAFVVLLYGGGSL